MDIQTYVNEMKQKIADSVAKNDSVKGIGQTGDINAKLIPGFSDIDIFVLCDRIPTADERKAMYEEVMGHGMKCNFNVSNGGLWGYGDIIEIEGIEVMFMFFLETEMESYIDSVLEGKEIENQGGFYPTGRVSSIKTISVLYEQDNTYSKLIEKIKGCPAQVFDNLFQIFSSRILNDEDLGRVTVRKDILFYHMVLEAALDNFLQALFAMNHEFFPSRKRSKEYLEQFEKKPENCYQRLLSIIQKSVIEEEVTRSVEELKDLTNELMNLA